MESLTQYSQLLDQSFAGINLGRIALAGAILFIALLLRQVLARLLARTLVTAAQRTAGEMDDVLLEQLKRPSSFLILIGGLWLASSVLGLPVEPVDLASGAEELIRLCLIENIGWFCLIWSGCWMPGLAI